MSIRKGIISVAVVQDLDKPNMFLSIGPRADQGSIRQWRGDPAFGAAFRDFRDLCEKIEPHTMKGVFSLEK